MPALTTLLPNDLIARCERLRFVAAGRATARGRGDLLAGRGGASTDFADYRDYVPGDDLRFVDWNIWARLRRPYLKQFRREEERHLVLVVDASRSMALSGKWRRARELAAALAVTGLNGSERVSIWSTVGDGLGMRLLPPTRGRAGLARAFAALDQCGEAEGSVPIEQAIETIAQRHRGRGCAVLLSDLLTEGDLRRALTVLWSSGLEPHALQILAPEEQDPELTGDWRLVDCETRTTLDVTGAGDLLRLYREQLDAYQQQLADWCTGRQGRWLPVSSAEPLDRLVTDRLRRAGWLA